MPSKLANWIIAAGVLIMFLGLCTLPAAFGEHAETNVLGITGSLFAMGALFAASGVYLKTRALQSKSGEKTAEPPRKHKGNCDLCHGDVAVIHCKVHQLHMCATCMAQHYDFRT